MLLRHFKISNFDQQAKNKGEWMQQIAYNWQKGFWSETWLGQWMYLTVSWVDFWKKKKKKKKKKNMERLAVLKKENDQEDQRLPLQGKTIFFFAAQTASCKTLRKTKGYQSKRRQFSFSQPKLLPAKPCVRPKATTPREDSLLFRSPNCFLQNLA